ncbi:hypothetical protein [Micromonospora maritima]|uniref:hypothetical protein n=1 Tax=Micromonospora maritima TaxID=986711 RepID=UPI0031F0EB46
MDAPRLDQETVERLLVGSADGPRPLARLLDAVRVPPRTGEVTGEAAAVAAFRQARAGDPDATASAFRTSLGTLRGARPGGGPGPGSRRRPGRTGDTDHRSGRRLLGLFGGKLAVAALIASLGGGVAVAAATGNLPGSIGAPAPTDDAIGGSRPAAGPIPTTHRGGPGVSPTAVATDPAATAGLCTAYRRLSEPERGRALDTPAFAGLISAAGDAGRVPGYCADLLHDSGTPGADGFPPTAGSGPPRPGGSAPPGPDRSGPPRPGGSGPPPPAATTPAGTDHPPGPPTGRRAG